MSASGHNAPLSIARLTLADAAQVLRKAGARHVTEKRLRADIEAGAPVNADGTLDLTHYAAWLVKEIARGA